MALSPVVATFDLLLRPIPPFTWFGANLSTLDVAAAARLCLVMRQLRDAALTSHIASKGDSDVEAPSLIKRAATTLTVVYGGEALMALRLLFADTMWDSLAFAVPWLGVKPSFLYSPLVPSLYTSLQYAVERLPAAVVPPMSLKTELPFSFLDGFSRSYLVCQLIPPVVLTLASTPDLATSPWTLLMSSLFIANSGFFFVNLLSMTSPTGFSLNTPPELQEYGWTTTDIWCAPAMTALYALLTHAQPFWANLHSVIVSYIGQSSVLGQASLGHSKIKFGDVQAYEPEFARAVCALVLTGLFATRTLRNFGADYMREVRGEKKRIMRSRVDGKRHIKTKTQ